MTQNEMILEILTNHSCLTSKEIANFVWRKYGESITPQYAASVVRKLYNQGLAGKGTNANHMTVYWLNGTGVTRQVNKL